MSATISIEQRKSSEYIPKILLIKNESCSYPGIDNAGQSHLEYAPNTFVIQVLSPVIFPESFYLDAFRKGFDGIIVMSCVEECPFVGAFKRLSLRINKIMKIMQDEYNLEPQRLKLTAICTVCAKHVVKEISQMNEFLTGKQPARQIMALHMPTINNT